MRVLASNHCGQLVHVMARQYPAVLGHLYSPEGFRGPFPHLPYALDNGAYPAWSKGTAWDEDAFFTLCDRAAASNQRPLWVVVPDVVADREATLALWNWHAPKIRRLYGWPLAFAVQDGMTTADIPKDADVIFVGGTTGWKWRTVPVWCATFPRVHVARVNAEHRLWQCHYLGAESCDGTGWFRGDARQLAGLSNYLTRMGKGLGCDPLIQTTDLFGDVRFLGGAA